MSRERSAFLWAAATLYGVTLVVTIVRIIAMLT